MSNIIPLDTANVPAHIAARMGQKSALADKLSGGISGGGDGNQFPRISIKGGRFRIKDGDAETVLDSTTIDVVVVDSNPRLSKTYYAKAWDPSADPSAPDCFSHSGVKPDASVQNPQSDMCATCPHNAWGSKKGPQGQDLKACSDAKRLAVVAADDVNGPVYLLLITPAALKDLNQFQKELAHRGIAPETVRMRLGFDTNASFPKLKFGFGGFLDEDSIIAIESVMAKPIVRDITGEASVDAVAAIPAPVAKPKPVLVSSTPEPVAAAPAAAPKGFGSGATTKAEAAPAPAKSKPAAKVADASLDDEIADLLGGMADDE